MNKLWGWIVAAFGLMGAALLYVAGQRNRAKEAVARAEAEIKSRKAVQEAEHAIDQARTQARKQSAETQREAEERPTHKRPSGHFRR